MGIVDAPLRRRASPTCRCRSPHVNRSRASQTAGARRASPAANNAKVSVPAARGRTWNKDRFTEGLAKEIDHVQGHGSQGGDTDRALGVAIFTEAKTMDELRNMVRDAAT